MSSQSEAITSGYLLYVLRRCDALAFVDGKFGADGITFAATHVNADGSTAYQDKAIARFDRVF
jgi:hypothetical protein